MNGIDRIIKRIDDDAASESGAILDRARAEADERISALRKEAEADVRVIVERGRALADERVIRLAGVAELEARKMKLAARQEMIGRAFDMAYEKLLSMPEDRLAAFLISLAVKSAGNGGELIFSKDSREKIGKKIAEAANKILSEQKIAAVLTLSDETRELDGGFILKDGSVEINCTFGAIIRTTRESLAPEIAGILFG